MRRRHRRCGQAPAGQRRRTVFRPIGSARLAAATLVAIDRSLILWAPTPTVIGLTNPAFIAAWRPDA